MLQTVQWPIFVQTNLTQETGSPKQIGRSLIGQSVGWLGDPWVIGQSVSRLLTVGGLVARWVCESVCLSSVGWSVGHQSAGRFTDWGGQWVIGQLVGWCAISR